MESAAELGKRLVTHVAWKRVLPSQERETYETSDCRGMRSKAYLLSFVIKINPRYSLIYIYMLVVAVVSSGCFLHQPHRQYGAVSHSKL